MIKQGRSSRSISEVLLNGAIRTMRRAGQRDVGFVLRMAAESGLSEWSHRSLVEEINRKDSIFLVASQPPGILCGSVWGRIAPGEHTGTGAVEIFNLGVVRNKRRLGIGSFLLDAFLNDAVQKGATEAFLEVRESNSAAINFYFKHGFETIGTRRSFYRDPVENATLMRTILNKHHELGNNKLLEPTQNLE